MTDQTHMIQDVNIRENIPLTAPALLKDKYPLTDDVARFVYDSREAVKRILKGEDRRLVAIVGPCSIHNKDIAIEYANRLAPLAAEVSDRIVVVMRVYFEKPRTTVGWKGLINDPHLNGTFDLATGVGMAREILLEVNKAGVPAATEMLEPITPQYIADLITVASIGARTTESPTQSPNGQWPFHACWLQEQHGRQPGSCDKRHECREGGTLFSGNRQPRQNVHREYSRQRHGPPDSAGRSHRPELRY